MMWDVEGFGAGSLLIAGDAVIMREPASWRSRRRHRRRFASRLELN
jgi:hypothetical protein